MKRLISIFTSLLVFFAPIVQTWAQVKQVEGRQTPGFYSYTNFVKNPFGEVNTTNVTATPASILAINTSNTRIEGRGSFLITATAAGQKVQWPTFSLDGGLDGQPCEARLRIKGDASNYSAYVDFGTATTSQLQLYNFVKSKDISIPYNCGSGLTQAMPTIISTGTSWASIQVDIVYSGPLMSAGQTGAAKRPGEVFAVATTTCPAGSLVADGSAVSRSTYGLLFAAIGISHGQGDSSSTFNIPDYRGRFLRGVDGTAGNDPDKTSRTAMATGGNTGNTVGSVQGHNFSSHTHIQNAHTHTDSGHAHGVGLWGNSPVATNYAASTGSPSLIGTESTNTGYAAITSTTATNQNTGGNETRPVNANVTYCVQYEDTASGSIYKPNQTVDLTGTIVHSAGVCPTGTILGDGSSVSQSTYPNLYRVLGFNSGNGSTAATGASQNSSGCPAASGCFNIPDYRGRFLRGVDGTAGRDPDKASRTADLAGGNAGNTVGSVQGHVFASHTHTQNAHTHIQDAHNHSQNAHQHATGGNNTSLYGSAGTKASVAGYVGLGTYAEGYNQLVTATNIATTATNQSTTATNQNTGGNETRPINANVNMCIVYDTAAYIPVLMQSVTADYAGITRINTAKSLAIDYTLTDSDETVYVDTSAANRTIYLPPAPSFKGKMYEIQVSAGTNQIILTPQSSTVCGQSTIRLSGVKDSVQVRSDGTNWLGVGNSCSRTVNAIIGGAGSNTSCTTSPCTIISQDYYWLSASSSTRNAIGNYSITWLTGLFSAAPYCDAFPIANNANGTTSIISSNAVPTVSSWGSILAIGATTAFSNVDQQLKITCMGPR
ncbi:MAG: phage tail protein [Pseudobdellovibrionaceae bacterium]